MFETASSDEQVSIKNMPSTTNDGHISSRTWPRYHVQDLVSQALVTTPHKTTCKRRAFNHFENLFYFARENSKLQLDGVSPQPCASNAKGSLKDKQGNRWTRSCYDTGCTGVPIPKESVESDSGPVEPLKEGAR